MNQFLNNENKNNRALLSTIIPPRHLQPLSTTTSSTSSLFAVIFGSDSKTLSSKLVAIDSTTMSNLKIASTKLVSYKENVDIANLDISSYVITESSLNANEKGFTGFKAGALAFGLFASFALLVLAVCWARKRANRNAQLLNS